MLANGASTCSTTKIVVVDVDAFVDVVVVLVVVALVVVVVDVDTLPPLLTSPSDSSTPSRNP